MNGRVKTIAVAVLMLLSLLAIIIDIAPRATAPPPITIYVDDDAPNDPGPNDPTVSDPLEDGSSEHPFDRIQEGVDAVRSGGTVNVCSGSYTEYVNVNKALKLIGEGRDNTKIWGGSGDHALRITAGGVHIIGFGITSSSPEAAGIHLESGGNTISDNSAGGDYGVNLSSSNGNVIKNNIVGGYVGIRLDSSTGNTITSNEISSSSSGILLLYSDGNKITSNTISGNGEGIYFWGGNDNEISDNTISNNGNGAHIFGSTENIITGNFISNNIIGIYMDYYSHRNTFTGNTISSNDDIGIYFDGSNENIISDNTISSQGGNGIQFRGSKDNYFINTSVSGSGNYDFYFEEKWTSHSISINTVSDNTKIYFFETTSTLTIKWYLHVNVIDSLDNPVPNANVKIEDNMNGSFSETYTTDENGHLRWLPLTEYVLQDSDGDNIGEKTYCTPHRIKAWNDTHVGYAKPSPTMDQNKMIDIPLYNGTPRDIALSNSDIQFSPPSPILNGTTTDIDATISSYCKSSSNVEVKFYNGDPDTNDDLIPDLTAVEIGNDTINIDKESSSIASIQWVPTLPGTYNIYVWADPNNNTEEDQYLNNLANKTLEVILGDLTLSDSDILFYPSTPVLNGTTITINATVFSYIASASNVEVKFYNGHPDADYDLIPDLTALEIGNDTINIDLDSSSIASIQWVPFSDGTYNIYAMVDTVNTTWESNECNNLASNTFSAFCWMDALDNYTSTETRQNITYYKGDAVLSLPYHNDFNSSDDGFTVESDYYYSEICWDASNQRVFVHSDRQDAGDELFTKPLPYTFTSDSMSWTLTTRWSTTQGGNWQYAFPIFISNISNTDLLSDPNTICIFFGSGDHTGNPPPSYYLRYRAGDGTLYLNEQVYVTPNVEYHFYISYATTSKNLTMEVRNANDVTLVRTSYIIGTNLGDNFSLGKFGVASHGKSESDSSDIYAWTDDVILSPIYKNGTLVSIPITLTPYKGWSALYIDKTEFPNTFINVTITNATSGEPIPGFMNLTENITDLTGLDPILYPSIKLVANFTGHEITSPKLHYWAINWATDSTRPTILLNSPENNSVIQSGTFLNFSILDSNLQQVNYSINDTGPTAFFSPFSISTEGWPEGNYTIQINAMDMIRNSNSSWFTFTIDSTPPTIGFDPTLNHSTIPIGRAIQLNISDLRLADVLYSVDEMNYSILAPPYIIDTSNWTDGPNIVWIKANDTVGNEAIHWFEITVDAIPPYVVSTIPINGSKNIDINTTIIITFSEPMNQNEVENYLLLSPSAEFTPGWDSNGTVLSISFETSNLLEGTNYNLTIGSQITDINGISMDSDYTLAFTAKFPPPDTNGDGTQDSEDEDDDDDGIPDEWENDFGLDPLDPNDAENDSDNDGFTNLDEYQEDTDPTDDSDYPKIKDKGEEVSNLSRYWWIFVIIAVIIIVIITTVLSRKRAFISLEEIEEELDITKDEPSEELEKSESKEIEDLKEYMKGRMNDIEKVIGHNGKKEITKKNMKGMDNQKLLLSSWKNGVYPVLPKSEIISLILRSQDGMSEDNKDYHTEEGLNKMNREEIFGIARGRKIGIIKTKFRLVEEILAEQGKIPENESSEEEVTFEEGET